MPSLRPPLRQYLGNSPEARAALDVAIALMLQVSEDFHAQDVGMSFLQGLPIEPEDKARYGFQVPSLPPREVIGAIDLLVAKAQMASVVCIDQLDGLIAISRQDSGNAAAEAFLLDQIANGLMDLAQDSQNSLIALSCLRPTCERIKSKTLESAPYRYPTVLHFRPIPSSEVGETLIAAYFDRAYKRVGFRPPYPTWPIKPTAFLDAQDYTPRRLIELCEAHVRNCRQTGVITELGAFPGSDMPRPQEPPKQNGPVEPSFFASLDADFAAAREAAAIDGALDEAHVDARLPALLQAGLCAWIDENNLADTFSVDGLPCRNPPLHAGCAKWSISIRRRRSIGR
jgi:hypothetical protein